MESIDEPIERETMKVRWLRKLGYIKSLIWLLAGLFLLTVHFTKKETTDADMKQNDPVLEIRPSP